MKQRATGTATERRRGDSEVAAIAKVQRALDGLTDGARSRVLNYLHARYCKTADGLNAEEGEDLTSMTPP
jgi:hypothetical protein